MSVQLFDEPGCTTWQSPNHGALLTPAGMHPILVRMTAAILLLGIRPIWETIPREAERTDWPVIWVETQNDVASRRLEAAPRGAPMMLQRSEFHVVHYRGTGNFLFNFKNWRSACIPACWGCNFLYACTHRVPATEHPTAAADPYHPPPADTVEAATYEGWKQFRLLCDRCHGEDAEGTSFGPNLLLSLKPDGNTPNRAAFVALLISGPPDRGMPPAARLGLKPESFDGLYDYLEGRSAGRFLGGRPARRAPQALP